MNMLKKVTKQCFKDTQQYFMMIIVGGIATGLCISSPVLWLFAIAAVILMFVGIVKTMTYLFHKSVFDESAVIYHMLPVSANEIIVSRLIVALIAWLIFQTVFIFSISFGIASLIDNVVINDVINVFFQPVTEANSMGMLALPLIMIGFLASTFFDVAFFFSFAGLNKSKEVKENFFLRMLLAAALVIVFNIKGRFIAEVGVIIMDAKASMFYLLMTIFILLSVLLGLLMCKLVKYRLEKRLYL